MPESENDTLINIRRKDRDKLKNYGQRHGLSMVEVLGNMIDKLEVKKLATESAEFDECEECGWTQVQKNARYCPHCGEEFEEDEDSDSDSDEEE